MVISFCWYSFSFCQPAALMVCLASWAVFISWLSWVILAIASFWVFCACWLASPTASLIPCFSTGSKFGSLSPSAVILSPSARTSRPLPEILLNMPRKKPSLPSLDCSLLYSGFIGSLDISVINFKMACHSDEPSEASPEHQRRVSYNLRDSSAIRPQNDTNG